MNSHTRFEDLSNEIFFEIFDYFHALDIFTSFSLLNRRISSILQSISLHIVILQKHCRHQIDLLSSYLTFHDHQVISIKTVNTIRDDSSIISLLFNRHHFINLKSCVFYTIDSSTRLENVIKQIKNLHQLVSFTIYQNNKNLNNNDTNDLTRILLMHKSSSIRSVILQYPYDYLNILKSSSISSNLISLKLWISVPRSTVSIYTVLSVLRLCHNIRYLGLVLQHTTENDNSNEASLTNDNDFPVLSQMVSCELAIVDMDIGDSRSITYILRCMPNLKHFYFHLRIQYSHWIFPDELLNGYLWQQMLGLYVPYLSTFEFHMEVTRALPKLNLDFIVNSFNYFVGKYSNWHMIIDQWMYRHEHQEFVMLSTLNYHKRRSMVALHPPCIDYKSFDTRSTTTKPDNHYLFYTHLNHLKIFVEKERQNVTWSSPLFQHITYLVVETPVRNLSWWNSLFDIVNFHQIFNTHDDDDDKDAQQTVTCLSHIVSLHSVTKLEFQSMFHITLWKNIQYILQACPNVINTSLLLSSSIIDNASLIPIFKQIKIITSVTENVYFPSNCALKFAQRFASLTGIELQVFSFDHAASIIDVFLTQLEHLSYVKIHYDKNTLLDDHFSRHYIIMKRRQSFSLNYLDEQMINVKNNGEIIEIWL